MTEFKEVLRRNKEQPNRNICHSHDFIDTNMVMFAAYKHITGERTLKDKWFDLWNQAWDLAKEKEFNP